MPRPKLRTRESWKLNYNIRPLSLAVTVTPLMGLLGTLQGMIIVFFRMANSPVGADRVLVLSDGIYLKLITAFAGLVVAVPALFAAHYFEGRVQALMQEVDRIGAKHLAAGREVRRPAASRAAN